MLSVLANVPGMYRAVELFRWGGGAWLLAGLTLFVVGLAEGDPRADSFAAILGISILGGLASVAWGVHRRLARAAFADTAEASAGRRAWRVALICAAPAILLVGFVPYPTAYTWLVGVAAAVSAIAQLTFAVSAARLERRHDAQVLQRGSRGFVLAR
jgi:hypothetical protein